MMRISTAYFAGVGTVVAAVAAGLGGGYLAANVVSPHEPGVSKLERRMSATQIAATTAPSEPVRIVLVPDDVVNFSLQRLNRPNRSGP